MLPVWTLLLLVVQALSSPRNAYYEGPDHLQTLTFALQDDGLTDQTHIQKFERILQCTEYFMTMIKNAKKKYKPIPMHPKMGKAKLTGIDSFDVANQIVLRKDQDYSTCEMIWSSFKSLMSGDIYDEIDNADDLVQYLSVLLSDESGKQKVFKVIPDMSYNTIDSDQEEMMMGKNAMKSYMKKLPQKAVVKNLNKRAGGGGQGGGGGSSRKSSSKNSDNDVGNDEATSSNKALDTNDSDETISGKNQFSSTSTNQQVGSPAVGPFLPGLFERRKRSIDALQALDILLTIFLDISPTLNEIQRQITGPIADKLASGMKKRSPNPQNPFTLFLEKYGTLDIDNLITNIGRILNELGRKKRSPEIGTAELCLSVSEKLRQLINDILGNILPPLRNVLKKRSPQGQNLLQYYLASTLDIEQTLHDVINILAILLGNPPPFKRSADDEINAISRHIRANNNENNKGKLNDVDIEKALQFLQSLGIDRSLFSSAGPNIGKRSALEMVRNNAGEW